MAVILDSNLLVALVRGDPRGDKVPPQFLDWLDQGLDLPAPALARQEVAPALTRLVVARAFPRDRVEEAGSNLSLWPIIQHSLVDAVRVVEIALTLKGQNAQEASYLVLAEELGADLYTLDGPLYRNATGQGFRARLLQ